MSVVAGNDRSRFEPIKPIKDAEGNLLTQDAYDDLVDEHDEATAKVAHLEAELAELRRRYDVIEKLPPSGYLQVEGEGGDIIQKPALLRAMVLAAVHGDIHWSPEPPEGSGG